MKRYKDNRGSEWHKWDLHVHTPCSGANNKFGGDTEEVWDKYIETLFRTAIGNEVAVIGITDYFLIDGYKKIKQDYLANEDKLIQLFGSSEEVDKVKKIRILPNIEFRLNSMVNGNRINYHVLLSDELTIQEIEDDFLGKLDIKIDVMPDGSAFMATLNRKGLEKLGATLRSQDKKFSGSDYYIGCDQACVSDDDIIKLLNNNIIFKDKFMIAIPVDEDLSDVKWHSQGHNERKKFYQQAHAFFTANDKTRGFALGYCHDTIEDYLSEFKSFKPCFVGCDAHSLQDINQKLGQWDVTRHDQSRITWIKADTTFDGLRQTMFEPETRVHIQPTCPETKAPMHVISSVRFISSDKTFNSSQRIYLNGNLNTVIGGKSSGKSLMIYSMANAINSELCEKVNNAIGLKGYDFKNDFEVEWLDGQKDTYSTSAQTHSITYIPQLYINFLAERRNRDDLNSFILELLLQNEKFKLYYEKFLLDINSFNHSIQENLGHMFSCLDELRSIRGELEKTGTVETLKKSIENQKKLITEITQKSTLSEKEKERYTQILQQQETFTKQKAKLQRSMEFATRLKNLLQDRIISLVGDDTPTDEHIPGELDNLYAYYVVGVAPELESIVNTVKVEMTEKMQYFIRLIDELTYDKQLNELQDQQNKLAKELDPYTKKIEGQKDITRLQGQLNLLNENLSKAQGYEQKRNIANKQYKEYRKVVSEQMRERCKLYLDFVNNVNKEYANIEQDITLESSILLNRETFPLYNYINKQRSTNDMFKKIFPEGSDEVNYQYVPDFFENIKSIKDGAIGFSDDSTCYLRSDINMRQLFSGIIENHFEISFNVKYKNDSLQQMSPGKKGTVLLILFLQISAADYPILIDQPEDNLDNRTIYTLLCKMVKRKKSDRQIIMVTHNANLVVGTDSENVIVANQEGQSSSSGTSNYRFEYVNGPIEMSFKDSKIKNELQRQGIREHVCDILEGGQDAFENREKKYGFKR